MTLASVGLFAFSPASSPVATTNGEPSHLTVDSGPSILVAPDQGPTGSLFTVTGSGFTPASQANVSFNFASITPTSQTDCAHTGSNITTNGSGGFVCPFVVPYLGPASYNVVGWDNATATATTPVGFTITALTISLAPAQGPEGSTFNVTGAGFSVSSLVNVSFDSFNITPATSSDCAHVGPGITTDSSGGFVCTFTVPVVPSSGPYSVVGTDEATSNDTLPATFTVTALTISVAPTQGPEHSTITVTGSGFSVLSGANFIFGTSTLDPTGGSDCNYVHATSTITTDSAGGFVCTFTVPTEAADPYSIMGTDVETGNVTNMVTFTVTSLAIQVAPTQGSVESTFTVTATGFTVSSGATLAFGGLDQPPTACSQGTFSSTAITTNSGGGFICTFSVPSEPPANYAVVAEDTATLGHSNSVTFTVTSLVITVAPGQGPVGASVTVTGTGFSADSTVGLVFDSRTITSCLNSGSLVADSSGGFTCPFKVPSGTSGTSVVATNLGGNTASGSFTVTPVGITVTPAQGPAGSSFTVVGSGFSVDSGATVAFEGVDLSPTACTAGQSSGTAITTTATGGFSCTFTVTSTETPGSYPVTGTDVATLTTTSGVTFKVTGLAITIAPGRGPVGATVDVSGTGFSVSTPLSSLVFDGVSITNLVSGSLTTGSTGSFACTFDVPSGTSGTTVTATDVGGRFATGTFTVTVPTITVTPSQGPVGSIVNVSGKGFSLSTPILSLVLDEVTIPSCTGGSLVTGTSGTFTCVFSVPSATSGTTVVATDGGGQPASGTFTVTTPSITVLPGHGPVGATLTVSGTGFSASTPLASLVFDGVIISGCSSGSLTTGTSGSFSCEMKVPGTTSGTTVTATDAGGQSATGTFTVTVPSITVTPGQGPLGANVTASGTGFSVSVVLASLVFDGVTVRSCTTGSQLASSSGAFSCTFDVPEGTSGTTVAATDSGGTAADATFVVTVPTISPTPGDGIVGSSFTVAGSGFAVSSGAVVAFDNVPLTPVACSVGSSKATTITTTSDGAFTCTFTLPTGPGGVGTLTATQPPNQANASFSITPSVTIAPDSGKVGATVNVTGVGFVGDTPYGLWWNTTTKLCSGTTNITGQFPCEFTVPSAPAGPHTFFANESSAGVSLVFSVIPSISVSPASGTVGTPVTVLGLGFAANAHYSVLWNGSTTLCSGTTNTNGAFSCSFTVPQSSAGSTAITTSEGTYAPSVSFSVTASPPPPPSSSAPFPWWEVAVVVLVIVALLVAALVFARRRPRHTTMPPVAHRPASTKTVQPWDEGGSSAPIAMPAPIAPPTAVETPPVAPPPEEEPEPNIDELIARLDRMQAEMFKKSPKQPEEPSSEDESADSESTETSTEKD